MAEAGGATTQSGILYQNSVTALYLGRLCDTARRPAHQAVVNVRAEAPTEVDDTVVTFADGHRLFIQAKEHVRDNDEAYAKLWRAFESQFWGSDFTRGRDRLLLHTGEIRDEHRELRELGERAASSPHHVEWLSRASEAQLKLLRKVRPLLTAQHAGDEELFGIFRHIDVEVRPRLELERDMVPYWMPPCNREPIELFRLLRDRVGGEARVRGTFTAEELRASLAAESEIVFSRQPGIPELRELVRDCGAGLEQHRHSFGATGEHLRRPVVGEILTWALADASAVSGQNVATLLDHAGAGKTVVMRDVLLALQDAGVTVLAVKADQISGITSPQELLETLRLPDSVERVLQRLATEGPVAFLIDQLDALSLSLARDQKALDVMLDTVARIRRTPGIRVIMSCRAFDLNNDQKLKNIDSGRRFNLTPLSDDEIRSVLSAAGIEYERLAPATRELLRIPLHLDLLTRAFASNGDNEEDGASPVEGRAYEVESLQDLYALLWDNVVLKADPEAPHGKDRERALYLLAGAMNRAQRTTVPRAVFTGDVGGDLEPALRWLMRERIVIPAGRRGGSYETAAALSFFHQTFFDYCYAKDFVEGDNRLYETVRKEDQGLFDRPKIIQVLAYLRGTDAAAYLRELGRFLNAPTDEIRFHLRDLVLRWFGSLSNPTDDEWMIAQRLLLDRERRRRVLSVMQGNDGWFRRLKESLAHDLEDRDDETLDAETLPFLFSMFQAAQADAASMLRPYVGRSERWDERLRSILGRNREWKTDEAVKLFEDVFRRAPVTSLGRFHQLDDLAKANPRAGCELIRIAFDRLLDEQVATHGDADGLRLHSLYGALDSLRGNTIVEALKATSTEAAGYFLEMILPWLERVVRYSPPLENEPFFFASDPLSGVWIKTPYVVQHQLNQAFITSLTTQARTSLEDFRRAAARLESLPYSTPQRIMAHVYRDVAEDFTEDGVRFLTSDSRRLNLGDDEQYDTRQLITALIPHLTDEQFARIEEAVLSFDYVRGYAGVAGLCARGLEQLRLLQCLPEERLSPRGAGVLRELERKFPGVSASGDPSTIKGGLVGPPIPAEAAQKMSDEAWLGAMEKYRGDYERRNPLQGGARQQASVLQSQVKESPERFYRFALRVPPDTDQAYLRAFISALADSSAPAGMLFDTVRRFSSVADLATRRAICSAVEKRAAEGVPEDVIDLLEGYVRGPAGEDETWWLKEEEDNRQHGRESGPYGGAYSGYLDSARGNALRAVMRALEHAGDETLRLRKWELIELIADSGSAALRAGAVEELVYLLPQDSDRAVSTFERLLAVSPELLRSQYAEVFIYYGMRDNFIRLAPYISAMMHDRQENHRQRGAELACIAAISPLSMESEEAWSHAQSLAEKCVTGEAVWRRGAARVYAANLTAEESDACAAGLFRLLNDEDEQVRTFISDVFISLREEHIVSLRAFIEAYAASASLYTGAPEFAEYLWAHGPLDPPWALSVVEAVLDNQRGDDVELHFAGGRELIQLVLRIYTDPTADDETRRRAMNDFDRLMERFAAPALAALNDWDRR